MTNRWVPVVLVVLASLVCGCSSASAVEAPSRTGKHLSFPSCTSAVAPKRAPSGARTAFGSVPGNPFGVVVTPNGSWSFVALGGSVGVFSDNSFLPRLVRTIPTPGTTAGEALTPDGKFLLVADGGSGAVVIDVARAERGSSGAVITTLSSPHGDGAVEVAVSHDGQFAFVTLEKSQDLAVFALPTALHHRGSGHPYVGRTPLSAAPVGLALSTSRVRAVRVGTASSR